MQRRRQCRRETPTPVKPPAVPPGNAPARAIDARSIASRCSRLYITNAPPATGPCKAAGSTGVKRSVAEAGLDGAGGGDQRVIVGHEALFVDGETDVYVAQPAVAHHDHPITGPAHQ